MDVSATKFRTGLYVDCHTLWHGVYAFDIALNGGTPRARPKVDYKRLLDAVNAAAASAGEDVVIKRAYIPQLNDVAASGFITALKGFGYEVKSWVARPGASGDKTAQAAIERDLETDADKWDGVILATQDTFFTQILDELRTENKRVLVAGFNPNYALGPFVAVGFNLWELGADLMFRGRVAS